MFVLLLIGLGAMVDVPGWDASAAYTATVEAPHGLTATAPTFHGVEEMISSESVHVTNEYGTVGLDVNECWLTAFIGGAGGQWEVDANYRGAYLAGASLEPIVANDGIPIFWQDPVPGSWGALFHDGTNNHLDISDGEIFNYTTGSGNGLWMHAPGQTPLVLSNNRTGIGHDATDGWVECLTGDLELATVGDVYTNDNFGVNTSAPSEAIHIDSGTIRIEDGNEAVGFVLTDDGTGTGVAEWAAAATGTTIEKSAETTVGVDAGVMVAITLVSPLADTPQDAMVWVNATATNTGVVFNLLSMPGPVADMATYAWQEDGSGDLEVWIWNDTQVDLQCTAFWVDLG